jgi:hypothetical protein
MSHLLMAIILPTTPKCTTEDTRRAKRPPDGVFVVVGVFSSNVTLFSAVSAAGVRQFPIQRGRMAGDNVWGSRLDCCQLDEFG